MNSEANAKIEEFSILNVNYRSVRTQGAIPHRIQEMKFFRGAFLILIAGIVSASPARSAESLDQTISYLIGYIASSQATFIRNGTSHSAAEAAEHVKAKYAHFKGEIKTPEDFIRLSASTSLLSGKPYLVRLPGGSEMRLDAWLTEALKRHQSESHP